MGGFSNEVWVILGGIGCVGVLAVLYTLAETVRCETTRHDVQVRAAELKQRYLAQLRGEEPVMVVDEAPEEPEPAVDPSVDAPVQTELKRAA
jgi:hypothetical protein